MRPEKGAAYGRTDPRQYAKPSNKGLFQVKDFWKYGHFRQQTLITPQGKDLLRMMLCGGQMSMEFDFCESEA